MIVKTKIGDNQAWGMIDDDWWWCEMVEDVIYYIMSFAFDKEMSTN